jgi:hypothetical protein
MAQTLFGMLGLGGNGIDYMDDMANPQAAAAYQPTGLLGRMGQAVEDNSSSMMGLGLGLLAGQGSADAWSQGMRGYLQGEQQDSVRRQLKQKQQQEEQKRTQAQALAQRYNLPPELATDPDTVFGAVKSLEMQKRTPTEWDRLTDGLSADELQKARRYRLGLETKPATTDDMLEFELAKRDPAFAEFLRSKKGAANAPSGYTYGPDGKLAPIPGGPQDPERDINEPLPGEIGARVGLANEYFKRFPRIEADLKSKDPKSVGPIDGLGFGQSGAIQRDIKLGSEAMIRMLTGAGMNKEEAENEVRQYLPGRGDDAATVLDKQYRLRAALRSMQREMLTGRRSRRQIDESYPELESPEFSEVEKRAGSARRVPIGQNRASAGAQGAINGQTRSGVTWSAR